MAVPDPDFEDRLACLEVRLLDPNSEIHFDGLLVCLFIIYI